MLRRKNTSSMRIETLTYVEKLPIQKDELDSPNTADSMPGGEILAYIDDMGIDCKMITRFSKIVLPNKKKTLSGIPMAMFQRLIMIKSMIDASEPTINVKMSAGRNLHPLKKF